MKHTSTLMEYLMNTSLKQFLSTATLVSLSILPKLHADQTARFWGMVESIDEGLTVNQEYRGTPPKLLVPLQPQVGDLVLLDTWIRDDPNVVQKIESEWHNTWTQSLGAFGLKFFSGFLQDPYYSHGVPVHAEELATGNVQNANVGPLESHFISYFNPQAAPVYSPMQTRLIGMRLLIEEHAQSPYATIGLTETKSGQYSIMNSPLVRCNLNGNPALCTGTLTLYYENMNEEILTMSIKIVKQYDVESW